ncbi:hypothetical protein CALCODRAFT_501284 [Calocera cornea HHB12733]|uniref:Uncharacterized protein n=1 Tax=Calocera cornea HHB12733 TaxID=1353952 RepID=A0A165DP76_9BASI|nr:hypothetical protein CALCODRAFT_501284 [Calocera cornea HHB12733]
MAAVGAVTYKWLGLDPTNEIDWSVASHALGEYCSTRQTILVHDQDVDLDMFRWTAEPVLRMRDAFGQDRLLRTPQARPLRDETLYENDELDAPATPVLSSTSSSPSGYERSFSLPPSPSDDCVVSIPPSPCADYYDPRGADEDHQGGTSAEEDMEVATVPFDNMNDYRRNLASPATDGHAIATALGSLNHCSDIPTLQESKRYRSEVGKTLLPSDAWEAGLAGAVQRVRKSHGSRKQWEEMRWKTQDKGKAAPVQEVQYRQQVQASLLDRMERSAEVSPRLAERRYARGSPYQ